MPPDQNQQNANNPEPPPTPSPIAVSPPPDIISTNEQSPEDPGRSKRGVILVVAAVLLIAGTAAAWFYTKKPAQKPETPASTTTPVATNTPVEYFLPPNDYGGPFIYKYSGTTTPPNKKPGDPDWLISEFDDGNENYFYIRQPLSDKENYCKHPTAGVTCGVKYKTAEGNWVFPSSDASGYVEIGGKFVLAFTNVNLKDTSKKTNFNIFVDDLSAVTPANIAAYNINKRQKLEWKKLYALPFPIYAPASTPKAFPYNYQDVTSEKQLYGNQRFLSTKYTNKSDKYGVDNTETTYAFSIKQFQKPAGFNVTGNCTIGTTEFNCNEVRDIATSPSQKATVNTAKYHLYRAEGVYDSNLVIADFGKTLVTVDSQVPTDVTLEDLTATLINSLNTMAPVPVENLQFVSSHMQKGL